MSVFNPPHFLRHIGMPTLREFTEAHLLGPYVSIDWTQDADLLPALVSEAVEVLATELPTKTITPEERKDIEDALGYWYDDLRRCHLMANALAVREFLEACPDDDAVLDAFADRDDREKAMWMFTFREKAFRDAELHLSFVAKTNGKYWKKHRIDADLKPTDDRAQLEAFSHDVAQLYKRSGGGEATHVEVSQRAESVQLTIYVEGPVTAFAHFTQNHFRRVTTRIALETALVYHPATGAVETVVKGGAKNHRAVLQLFGQHVVRQEIKPEEIEPKRYRLNTLRDGLEPFEDWTTIGVQGVRLRRATLAPMRRVGVTHRIEASADRAEPDAIEIARGDLNVEHSFEAEYNLDGATLTVFTDGKGPQGQFSFDLFASGSSTIKNLPEKNQTLALAVLQALNVIEPEAVESVLEENALA